MPACWPRAQTYHKVVSSANTVGQASLPEPHDLWNTLRSNQFGHFGWMSKTTKFWRSDVKIEVHYPSFNIPTQHKSVKISTIFAHFTSKTEHSALTSSNRLKTMWLNELRTVVFVRLVRTAWTMPSTRGPCTWPCEACCLQTPHVEDLPQPIDLQVDLMLITGVPKITALAINTCSRHAVGHAILRM